jgi:hypothetical protein
MRSHTSFDKLNIAVIGSDWRDTTISIICSTKGGKFGNEIQSMSLLATPAVGICLKANFSATKTTLLQVGWIGEKVMELLPPPEENPMFLLGTLSYHLG